MENRNAPTLSEQLGEAGISTLGGEKQAGILADGPEIAYCIISHSKKQAFSARSILYV